MGFDPPDVHEGADPTGRRLIEYCKARYVGNNIRYSSIHTLFLKYMHIHSADMTISVSPLASGYSSDIHGIIKVERGLDFQLIKYKAMDSGIKCSLFGR